MNKLDEIAATFLWLEDVALKDEAFEIDDEEILLADFESYDQVLEYWERIIIVIEEDPLWANGKHNGDCNKKPFTCFRCFVEEFRGYAQQWLDWFNTGKELWK